MQLNDPAHQDSVPTMVRDSPPPGACFRPSPLCHTVTAFMHRALERNQFRRQVYRASHLRVCIDGEQRLQIDPKVGVLDPFRVPTGTSYMEIFGDDDDGNLLLAVVPLPEPEVLEDDRVSRLYVTLEGGQTVEIDIALDVSTAGEVSEYVIQISYVQSPEADRRNAEHPSVEVIPRVPLPRTATSWNAASRNPDDDSAGDRADPGRDLVMAANDRRKISMTQLVGKFYPVIQQNYRQIAGTTGTAEAVRHWIPMVQPLGYGPATGEQSLLWRSWRMLLAILAYCRERGQLNREVHLFVFFDPELEKHPPFREMLTASLLLTGAYWFPTPATARVYLHTLRGGQMKINPPLGTFRDNERAFAMAMQHMTVGEYAAGLKIFEALGSHIGHTGEPQSRIWLLPAIQAILERSRRSRESATRS
jgi:hypothetical protein